MKTALANPRMIFTALLALAAAPFALSACTNSASTANGPKESGPPPAYTAPLVKGDPMAGQVGSSPIWRDAPWVALSRAARENRQTPSTRAACVYDRDYLYVAVAGATGSLNGTSSVSVWLDTSAQQNGTEMIEIEANPLHTAQLPSAITWHRCVTPPEPRETPDFALPMDRIPEKSDHGITLSLGKGVVDGREAWTVVFKIPLKSLHMAKTPTTGFAWRFNLMRIDSVAGSQDRVQANFSPVFANAQQVMPYRMATLTLGKQMAPAVGNAPAKTEKVALSR